METMTKKEAIKKYLGNMDDVDLIDLVRDINSYGIDYEPWAFYSMDELDDVFCSTSPTEIIDMVQDSYGRFTTYDDYFYFDECGTLNSCDVATAADLIRTDILNDLTNDFYEGRYKDVLADDDFILFDIVDSPNNVDFDKDYKIVK
jgi:hypothetical protein